jgi:hypothetical protein
VESAGRRSPPGKAIGCGTAVRRLAMDRTVNVIENLDGKKTVIIQDIRFRGKRNINWTDVETITRRFTLVVICHPSIQVQCLSCKFTYQACGGWKKISL